MALYAIGDFHLSFGTDKPMSAFGERWVDFESKIQTNFSSLNDDDVTVICGDISWAMSLEEAEEDFRFINSLPGKKIIIKGNHDYWWTTLAKINAFLENKGFQTISILQNNSFEYGEYSICGTRGWFFDVDGAQHDEKIMRREVMRMEASLQSAVHEKKIAFLHYPPFYLRYRFEDMVCIMEKYGVTRCCYGHLHGKTCDFAGTGFINGIDYRLVSADYLDFMPIRLL